MKSLRSALVVFLVLVLSLACTPDPDEVQISGLPEEASGRWHASDSDLPEQFPFRLDPGVELIVGVAVRNDLEGEAGGLSVSTSECSSFGGSVASFEPVEFTLTTQQGVGDCSEQDQVAKAVLRQIDGATPMFIDESLVIEIYGQLMTLSRSDSN